ncbi:hypothetical protein Barb4_03174 [Bacteroidales bacterium Barb4]|nr:hypothetical protein Barb4_03174 [Bacteroidales bacterium Barb4]
MYMLYSTITPLAVPATIHIRTSLTMPPLTPHTATLHVGLKSSVLAGLLCNISYKYLIHI